MPLPPPALTLTGTETVSLLLPVTVIVVEQAVPGAVAVTVNVADLFAGFWLAGETTAHVGSALVAVSSWPDFTVTTNVADADAASVRLAGTADAETSFWRPSLCVVNPPGPCTPVAGIELVVDPEQAHNSAAAATTAARMISELFFKQYLFLFKTIGSRGSRRLESANARSEPLRCV